MVEHKGIIKMLPIFKCLVFRSPLYFTIFRFHYRMCFLNSDTMNHIKCIVWEINKQYQMELPLVLYSTGSSLKIGFRTGSIKWVKTLLTNSSRIITCVVFLQFRQNENRRRRSTRRTRGKEVEGQTYTINLQQTEPKFCKNHLRNEAYSRRNRSSLRNQDIIIKTSNYLTSSIITHNNLNHTHEKINTL